MVIKPVEKLKLQLPCKLVKINLDKSNQLFFAFHSSVKKKNSVKRNETKFVTHSPPAADLRLFFILRHLLVPVPHKKKCEHLLFLM